MQSEAHLKGGGDLALDRNVVYLGRQSRQRGPCGSGKHVEGLGEKRNGVKSPEITVKVVFQTPEAAIPIPRGRHRVFVVTSRWVHPDARRLWID